VIVLPCSQLLKPFGYDIIKRDSTGNHFVVALHRTFLWSKSIIVSSLQAGKIKKLTFSHHFHNLAKVFLVVAA
jgi:hypothetical protein